MENKYNIEELWRNRTAPRANSITISDGTMVIIECETFEPEDPNVKPITIVRPLAVSTLDSYFSYNSDDFASLHVNGSVSNGDLILYYGEADNDGASGFIALESVSNARLIWLVFLMDSNPFVEGWLSDTAVEVRSTLGTRWTIPIQKPELIATDLGESPIPDSR